MAGPTGLLIGGINLDLAVRADATRVFLRKIDEIAQEESHAAVATAGNNFLKIVHRTVAYDTGRMQRLVKVVYSPKGFAFEGGWDQDDFTREGEPFYPPFVEFGTSRQAAQPSILPAYDRVAARLEKDLAGAVRRSISRAGR